MSAVLEKFERIANAVEKFSGLAETIPRLIEMGGVALFAGRASKLTGGSFELGALSGAVADGLAHSNVGQSEIGGLGLMAYFAGIGLVNAFVPETVYDDYDAAEAKRKNTRTSTRVTEDKTVGECRALGGVLGAFTGEFKPAGPLGIPQRLLQCTYDKPDVADAPPFSAGMDRRSQRRLEAP